MEIDFVKMDGLGNDFVFIDDLSNELELTEEQVKHICDRHFGIGGDGVILVRPSCNPDCVAYMHYINSDGSLAEMCGNGVRCFAKYLVDHGFVQASDRRFIADTKAGVRPIAFEVDEDEKMTVATVDMGKPILAPGEVPVALTANAQTPSGDGYVADTAISSPWGDFAFTCVSMGNPHAVCFIDSFENLPDALFKSTPKSIDSFDVDRVGSFFESNAAFPAKANIEFAEVRSDSIRMRVYERGDGETLACGTGACATSVAAALTGRRGRVNDIVLQGGTLHIEWHEDDHVFMTGPASSSFVGTIEL